MDSRFRILGQAVQSILSATSGFIRSAGYGHFRNFARSSFFAGIRWDELTFGGPCPGTGGARCPLFHADGRRIGREFLQSVAPCSRAIFANPERELVGMATPSMSFLMPHLRGTRTPRPAGIARIAEHHKHPVWFQPQDPQETIERFMQRATETARLFAARPEAFRWLAQLQHPVVSSPWPNFLPISASTA